MGLLMLQHIAIVVFSLDFFSTHERTAQDRLRRTHEVCVWRHFVSGDISVLFGRGSAQNLHLRREVGGLGWEVAHQDKRTCLLKPETEKNGLSEEKKLEMPTPFSDKAALEATQRAQPHPTQAQRFRSAAAET